MISLMGHEGRRKESPSASVLRSLWVQRKKCHLLKLLMLAAFRRPQKHQSLAQQSGDMRLAALHQLATLVALDWKAL